jgi:hypothetical protein
MSVVPKLAGMEATVTANPVVGVQQLANKVMDRFTLLPARANTIATSISLLRSSRRERRWCSWRTEESNGDRAFLESHDDGEQS